MRWVPPAHSPLHWSDLSRTMAPNSHSQDLAREAVLRHTDADAVLLCDSGTSALVLALRAARHSHPGMIAVPGYACFDIATAVSGSEDSVWVYDIDPHTLGPDLESLRRALQAGARRVIAAPLYGVPLDWGALRRLCDEAGALLIEDAAQGSGAEWEGHVHGTLGDLAVLSFGRGKGRTAGGGGALVAHGPAMSDALEDVAATLRPAPAGRLNTTLRLAGQLTFSDPTRFGLLASVPSLGIGDTELKPWHRPRGLSDAEAAIVPLAFEREADEVMVRRRHAERWIEVLPETIGRPRIPANAKAGYLRFPILRERTVMISRSQRELGVGAPYPRVLSEIGPVAVRSPNGRAVKLTGSRLLVSRLATLPTHSLLTEEDYEALTHWLAALG